MEGTSNVVIKQADKGGSIVFQNTEDYHREAYRLLDNNAYKKLPNDPLPKFQKALNTLVEDVFRHGCWVKKRNNFYYQKSAAPYTSTMSQRSINPKQILLVDP